MTREETKELLELIATAYPVFTKGASPQQMSRRIDLWSAVLVNDEYEAIKASLVAYIQSDTSGFAPTVAQLRTGAIELAEGADGYDDTEEVIGEIRKAISRSSYYSDVEFENLSDDAKAVVRRPENLRAWAMLEADELETVTMSHLRRIYRAVREQKRQLERLKPVDRQKMLKIQENLAKVLAVNKEQEQLPFEDEFYDET